jgi:hypothetical protein
MGETAVLEWINKNLSEIKDSLLYSKYFDTTLLEKGIDVYFLFNPLLGIDLVLTEDYSINAIHFFSGKDKTQNASQYSDDLPCSLRFSDTRKTVRNQFGHPQKSGGGAISEVDAKIIPFWDKYVFDRFSLHIQYDDNGTTDLITVESLYSRPFE